MMVYCLLSRSNLVTFVVAILLCQNSNAFLKQILGAAFMGDVGSAAISSITCAGVGDNFSRFVLYSRKNTNEAFTLSSKNTSNLYKTNFNPSIPTKIIIHGFLDSNLVSDWMLEMKNALLQVGNYNVIIMDWSCANGFPYLKAVRNAKTAATHLHKLLLSLKSRGANFSDMHLIGHSLGSQIAGIVGNKIQNLGRISGLDPAGPMFYEVSSQERLDSTDANFVDVIHTDGGNNLFEGLGLSKRSGHMDFYPNGGTIQPGCHSSPLDVIERVGIKRTARYFFACDHYQSINLYLGSIKQEIYSRSEEDHCEYVGVKCLNWETFSRGRCVDCSSSGSCVLMGFNSDKYYNKNVKSANVYFLKTADDEPYCNYQYGVTLETGSRFALRKAMYNYTRDVIMLEVVKKNGYYIQLKLNERREDYLQASTKYSYLVISKDKIRDVESASMWLGTDGKPPPSSPRKKTRIGVRIKEVEILPIEVNNTEKKSPVSKLPSKKIVLCGGEDNILTRGEVLKLSTHC